TMVLTTANFIATGRIPVSLPQTSRMQVERHHDKIIELTAAGELYLDDVPATKDQFEDLIAGLPPDTSFLIRADRNVAFQKFIDVAAVLKRRNFTKVAVQTQNIGK